MVLSGLGMSPEFVAACPWLPPLFGGSQTARTMHFMFFFVLLLFVAVHLVMVALTGFRRQLRAMIVGRGAHERDILDSKAARLIRAWHLSARCSGRLFAGEAADVR